MHSNREIIPWEGGGGGQSMLFQCIYFIIWLCILDNPLSYKYL